MRSSRIEYIVTGGAVTSPEIIDFLKKCFKCPVYDGYGTTCGPSPLRSPSMTHGSPQRDRRYLGGQVDL